MQGAHGMRPGRGGRGVLPYKDDEGGRRKISKIPQIKRYQNGRVPNSTPMRYQFDNNKLYNWHCKFEGFCVGRLPERKTLQIAKIRRFQLQERQHTTFQVKIHLF